MASLDYIIRPAVKHEKINGGCQALPTFLCEVLYVLLLIASTVALAEGRRGWLVRHSNSLCTEVQIRMSAFRV